MTAGGVTTQTLYLGGEVEITNPSPGAASTEVVHWYIHPSLRIKKTRAGSSTLVMHRDQLNSVVMMTDNSADWGIERVYASVGWNAPYSNSVAVDPPPESIEYRARACAAM